VWIGELQWRLQHGYPFKVNPILDPLDQIECRDALLNADGSEAAWPQASVVVGNPPFVGDKKMRAELGHDYTERLRATFDDRVPGGADLVCYWFEKARAQIEHHGLHAAGLVATNSIRGGRNREVLARVVRTTRMFEAWSDEPWINDGAAVRVSLVAFGRSLQAARLNGVSVHDLNADLTSNASAEASIDLTRAAPLGANRGTCFIGAQQNGAFAISGDTARAWLRMPSLGTAPKAQVVRQWSNGKDITDRRDDHWLIDFGTSLSEVQASLYDEPFEHVIRHVKPSRLAGNRESRKKYWWRLGEPAPAMRASLVSLSQYIATSRVSKHRVWDRISTAVLADVALVVVARADDTTFGILHGRPHELWALRLGTSLEDRPRYTPTTCFETFPFPAGLTPADTAHQRTETLPDGAVIPADLPPAVRPQAEAIARAAQRLVALRERWLNPPEWTQRVPEVVPLGLERSPYPDRIVARPGHEKDLAQRTLTKLYNARPAWLAQAHAELDAAVAAAYGWADWTPALTDDEILRRLLALNRERAHGHRPSR
jgi:hypothetical protein